MLEVRPKPKMPQLSFLTPQGLHCCRKERLSQAVDFGGIGSNILSSQFFPALPAAFAASGVPAPFIPGFVTATEQAYAKAGFVPLGRDGVAEVHGDDWDVGFTVGVIFEYLKGNEIPCLQEGRIGFSYRSGIEHDIRGSAQFSGVPVITASEAFSPLPGVTLPIPAFPAGNALRNVFFNQNARARLDLPEIYHFSIYQRFLLNFALMGDIELQRWTRLQQIPITFDNPGTPANVLNLQYKDAYRYSVGLEWYATKQLTLRTGFAYDETPIKNATLRDPRIPDNNRYFLSAGLQYKPLPYLAFDVGYAHLFIPDPQVNFNDGQGHILRGKYDISIDILSASVTLLWGGPREAAAPETPGKQPGDHRSLRSHPESLPTPFRKHQLRGDISDRHQHYQHQRSCPGELNLIVVRKRRKIIDQHRKRSGFIVEWLNPILAKTGGEEDGSSFSGRAC